MENQSEFYKKLYQEHQSAPKCATPSAVGKWFKSTIGLLFPGFCEHDYQKEEELVTQAQNLEKALVSILSCGKADSLDQSTMLARQFFEQLPELKDLLEKDIDALYEGDPAAKSRAEIIRSYPGFYAIAAHRVGHSFYKMNIPLIPRIISENAHAQTGVDIHPGAQIGAYFCIDHGTGVVVGETTVVGNHVKIYQGVTLGALSVENRNIQNKRHPTIEDHVVIYAGATILGGNTVVGAEAVIGGGVWLTKSVPPKAKVYYRAKMSNEDGGLDVITFKP